MKVECLKFNTYHEDSDEIANCINSAIEDKEVIDIKVTSATKTDSMVEDEMLIFVTILYK